MRHTSKYPLKSIEVYECTLPVTLYGCINFNRHRQCYSMWISSFQWFFLSFGFRVCVSHVYSCMCECWTSLCMYSSVVFCFLFLFISFHIAFNGVCVCVSSFPYVILSVFARFGFSLDRTINKIIVRLSRCVVHVELFSASSESQLHIKKHINPFSIYIRIDQSLHWSSHFLDHWNCEFNLKSIIGVFFILIEWFCGDWICVCIWEYRFDWIIRRYTVRKKQQLELLWKVSLHSIFQKFMSIVRVEAVFSLLDLTFVFMRWFRILFVCFCVLCWKKSEFTSERVKKKWFIGFSRMFVHSCCQCENVIIVPFSHCTCASKSFRLVLCKHDEKTTIRFHMVKWKQGTREKNITTHTFIECIERVKKVLFVLQCKYMYMISRTCVHKWDSLDEGNKVRICRCDLCADFKCDSKRITSNKFQFDSVKWFCEMQ